MQIPVLVEPISGNAYRASVGAPLTLTAEGRTRDEALVRLRDMIVGRVAEGASIVSLDLLSTDRPWARFAGMLRDDPHFDDWQAAIAEYRLKVDSEPEVRVGPAVPADVPPGRHSRPYDTIK